MEVAMESRKEEERVIGAQVLNYVIGVTSLILILACAFLVIHRQNPPAAQPAAAPPEAFASARAMERLKLIATKPRPIGSTKHAEVRDYIVRELAGLGLNPEVQKTSVLSRQRRGSYLGATVHNVLGRIKGAGSRPAVLLACHYDSVPTSLGASDDGSGIAALLEVIRALRAGPPPKNDILFLFTDSEEVGSLGAQAFINEHPAAGEVALALNFEARGVGGPSIMFETSEGNRGLIKELAEAAPHPVASSLTYDLYQLLPNATDLTIFKNGGLQGLNFAFITGLSSYHTALDSYENLDERSLQHQGSSALALARHFGNLSDWPAREGNAVYFDLFSSALISYSESWVLPLMILSLVCYLGLVILGLRMKRLTIRGIAFGALGFLLNVIGVGVALTLIWQAVQRLSPHPARDPNPMAVIGFLSLTIALTATLFIWLRKKTEIENLVVGALLWWAAFTVLMSLAVPGGSYLFTWPLLLALSALGTIFILRKQMTSTKSLIVLTLPACAMVILIAPLIRLTIVGFGMEIVGMLMIFIVFLLALLPAHLKLLMAARPWALPAASGLLGAGLIGAALLMTGIGVKQPKRNHIFYALNADTGKAIWGSGDENADEWTTQFFSPGAENADLADYFPWGEGPFLKGSAPVLPLEPPRVEMIDDQTAGGLRSLRLRVISPRKAPAISIYWPSKLELEALTVNGKRIKEEHLDAAEHPARYRGISYFGLPEEGLELSLEIKSSQPVEIKVEDRSYGLPEIRPGAYRDRPEYIIASPLGYSDCTIVNRSVTF